jgi:hypothetical protein
MSEFAPFMPRNPRGILRIANRYCVDRAIAGHHGTPREPNRPTTDEREFVYWAIVAERWPVVAEYLAAAAWVAQTPHVPLTWPADLFHPEDRPVGSLPEAVAALAAYRTDATLRTLLQSGHSGSFPFPVELVRALTPTP